MKLVLTFLMLIVSSFSFADEILSTRLFSTSPRSLDLPADLSFKADRVRGVDANWFASIFEKSACQGLLAEIDMDLPIEIKGIGTRKLSVTMKGKQLRIFNEAYASYVPLFFQHSMPVHPHFMVKLKDWVLLHLVIHRNGETKHLKLSVVHIGKDGEGNSLHPVLEADGI